MEILHTVQLGTEQPSGSCCSGSQVQFANACTLAVCSNKMNITVWEITAYLCCIDCLEERLYYQKMKNTDIVLSG